MGACSNSRSTVFTILFFLRLTTCYCARKMEGRNWKQVYRDQNQQARSLLLKNIELVHLKCEELRTKKRHHDKLLENIAGVKSQIKTVDTSVVKIVKETKETQLKSSELKSTLRNEKVQVDNLQSEMKDMKKVVEENEKLFKEIQNKGNAQLMPYQESMGITIERCKNAELAFRILFRTPSNKICQLKLASSDNKLKVVKCLPMLSNQQILEDHLNLTNDCPGFITHIHSLFMKSSSH